MEVRKKGLISLGDLLTTESRLTGRQFAPLDLSPSFLNAGTIEETFQRSEK